MKDLDVKEMPLEQKFNGLFDFYMLDSAINYAYHEEQGTVEQWLDYTLEGYGGYMGPMFEMMKKVTPGKAFKEAANQMVYMQQMWQPLSEIEVSLVSDREAVMRFKNCEMLRRSREIVKKAGLKIDPKFFCKMDLYRHAHPSHPLKEFMTCELEENGCKWTLKLK